MTATGLTLLAMAMVVAMAWAATVAWAATAWADTAVAMVAMVATIEVQRLQSCLHGRKSINSKAHGLCSACCGCCACLCFKSDYYVKARWLKRRCWSRRAVRADAQA